jgi:hypothetical protein
MQCIGQQLPSGELTQCPMFRLAIVTGIAVQTLGKAWQNAVAKTCDGGEDGTSPEYPKNFVVLIFVPAL